MKVLVVAAHPDDEVLGCGGTIARLARQSHEIFIGILGEGISSRYADRRQADKDLLAALHRCSREAGGILGAKEVEILDLPDNRFDTVALLDVIKSVERLVERFCPETVYTHHAGDLNVDHAVTARAVLTATRPIAGSSVREVLAFEVPSSTEWAFGCLDPEFRPNLFMDISSTLDLKLQAMSIYRSEMREFPHPRSPEAVRSAAARWGSVSGCEAAEAFALIRSLR